MSEITARLWLPPDDEDQYLLTVRVPRPSAGRPDLEEGNPVVTTTHDFETDTTIHKVSLADARALLDSLAAAIETAAKAARARPATEIASETPAEASVPRNAGVTPEGPSGDAGAAKTAANSSFSDSDLPVGYRYVRDLLARTPESEGVSPAEEEARAAAQSEAGG